MVFICTKILTIIIIKFYVTILAGFNESEFLYFIIHTWWWFFFLNFKKYIGQIGVTLSILVWVVNERLIIHFFNFFLFHESDTPCLIYVIKNGEPQITLISCFNYFQHKMHFKMIKDANWSLKFNYCSVGALSPCKSTTFVLLSYHSLHWLLKPQTH